MNIVDKSIYEDVAKFYNLRTANLSHFKRILNFLSSISPGSVKTNNIAKHLHIDNKTVDHYLEIMQRTGLIRTLYPIAKGNQILTKPSKIYANNTTLLVAMNTVLSTPPDLDSQRELAFLQFIQGAKLQAFFPDAGDFKINDVIFEVGGKNKTWQQLKNEKGRKFLVKNNLLVGYNEQIPLYLFGFLY